MTATLARPEPLDALALARAIEAGTLTCEALVRRLLERIEAREGDVKAWTHIDPGAALDAARTLDRTPRQGLLHGLPVGIKDVIDTADMPTRYGSPIYANHQPAIDAAPVAAVRAAGGLILGKHVTAEFAHRVPGETRNPHDLARTPGGSSSGSGAAVGDGMVPLAIGTQTTGSTIRPASYCGVVGYRPTFGIMGIVGVKPSSPSFDTVGLFAGTVASCALLRDALLEAPFTLPRGDGGRLRIGVCRTARWDEMEPATADALEAAFARLGVVAEVRDVALPVDMSRLAKAQRTVSAYEIVRSLASERRTHYHLLSEDLRNGRLAEGQRIDHTTYVAALADLEAARAASADWFDAVDCVVAPAAKGIASLGIASTGASTYCLPWTALHVPALSLPLPERVEGMPVGLQVVAGRGRDLALFDCAQWIADRL
ncbi:amidase [Acuticoccus mangrovi]|uniref:Amidase n=1 Tax=Acuticoccus mangrovi TaxID=2796142 RepID=A0A934ITN5_9HYPH|nr:amidase [Acuticoccus mangrovi]MBJ3778535.1 amidase [Acuticoccus mangrovi]